MTEWIRQTNIVRQIATSILLPKQSNYHQDFLIYKMSKIKHLQFKNFKVENQFHQVLQSTIIINKQTKNNVCIIFLHGYCSNRLEGLTLLQTLPKDIDFCCFDFSASGKSQGKINTFGLKQFKDIRAIINKLKSQEYNYKKFILWGRSMGAVASFLFTCSNQIQDQIMQRDIIFQVLDSPFNTFESICYHQGKQSLKLPQPFINIGIKILKNYFQSKQSDLNPFNINLKSCAINCKITSLFVFNQKDNIIPPNNSLQIIQQLNHNLSYQKLIIEQQHNTLRKSETNQQIFVIVRKNYLKWVYNQKQIFKSKNDINFYNENNKQKLKIYVSNHIKKIMITQNQNNSNTKIKYPKVNNFYSQPVSTQKIEQQNNLMKQTISSQTAIVQDKQEQQKFQNKFSFKKRALYCSLHKKQTHNFNNNLNKNQKPQFLVEEIKRKSLIQMNSNEIQNQEG